MRRRRFVLPMFCLLLSGCYCLAKVPHTVSVRSREHSTPIVVRTLKMVGARGEPSWMGFWASVLFYPADVICSTIIAVCAPFDQDEDIAWGPFGAVAAIALPGLTLFSGIKRFESYTDLQVTPEQLAELSALQRGGEQAELERRVEILRASFVARRALQSQRREIEAEFSEPTHWSPSPDLIDSPKWRGRLPDWAKGLRHRQSEDANGK